MKLRITFLGAAENVTGSRTLLQIGDRRILFDCGLHQEREFRDRDFAPFPVPPESIDAVVLTHAHLDHCGYLPKLCREGFTGAIHTTPATAEIARIVLLDSAFLQQEDVRYKLRRHAREGKKSPHPYVPLYTVPDAEACLPQFVTHRLGEVFGVVDDAMVTFRNAGHILGSAFAMIDIGSGENRRRLLFSGDVGRLHKPIIKDPVQFDEADYVILESTYGDREHDDAGDIPEQLAEVINDTVDRGGNVLIPAFSIERSQEVLYHLHELMRAKRIPRLLTFLDSPMAQKVTDVFERHPELYDDEMGERIKGGDTPFHFPQLKETRSADESKAINLIRGSAIIIAGAGMCTGGRIKHHLALHISRKESTVLFVGYQASGTLGRQILDGDDKIRILGAEHKIRARIARIGGFSAHADRKELVTWITSLRHAPRRTFTNHGEREAAHAFRDYIAGITDWDVVVPQYRNEYVLD
jgi:metallo-beta-lactamase family protein